MVLKRGENVGERLIRHSSEQEVLEVIVSGRRETVIRETAASAEVLGGSALPAASLKSACLTHLGDRIDVVACDGPHALAPARNLRAQPILSAPPSLGRPLNGSEARCIAGRGAVEPELRLCPAGPLQRSKTMLRSIIEGCIAARSRREDEFGALPADHHGGRVDIAGVTFGKTEASITRRFSMP